MRSMTGFGASQGGGDGVEWRWDLRSVNGRGLEMRFRLPPGWETQERTWRARLSARLSRGSVTAWLGIAGAAGESEARLDMAALDRALAAVATAAERIEAAGLQAGPVSPTEVLALRGVYGEERAGAAVDRVDPALAEAVTAGFDAALDALETSRRAEGARLAEILTDRLDQVDALRADAAVAAARRGASVAERLRQRVGAIVDATTTGSNGQLSLDEGRLAQELALLAVKADVTEELDRLGAHSASARSLLTLSEPSGRKLEFLAQELNREANTLCAKSQDAALTDVGLRLKATIDQIREQAANVE